MNLNFKNTLVTGGAGFIGSHLVEALVDAGCSVTVIDNLSTGRLSNLAAVRDRITFYQGDFRDPGLLKQAVTGCDVLFHLAAIVSVPWTVENPVDSAAVNEMGTLQVLETARRHHVRRFIGASSCAVYGDGARNPKQENMPPNPLSPYAIQKLVGEQYSRLYSELYGMETLFLRYFNVYGPRQDPSSPYSGVISIFIDRAIADESPVIYGDGLQYRDFVYVKDVVQANLLAAAAKTAGGHVFNIGTGEFIRIRELWQIIGTLAETSSQPVFRPQRPGEILESVADIDRARCELGFKPAHSLKKGLQITLEWYRRQKR
ncbi:MAG: SDR family oxidoreductase [Desulfobacterales bacterium]|nr:SDR family oxidoreductase [Desulfobacterales bacterium]